MQSQRYNGHGPRTNAEADGEFLEDVAHPTSDGLALLGKAVNTLREAARRLRDGGRIVNFSSSVTSLLQPTYGVYAATKAAVEAMTSILAKELRGRNITVNAIAPGPTATKLFLDGKPQEVIERAASWLRSTEPEGEIRGQ